MMHHPAPVIRDEHGTKHAPVPQYSVIIADNPRLLTTYLNQAVSDGWRFVGAAAGTAHPKDAFLWAIWLERPT